MAGGQHRFVTIASYRTCATRFIFAENERMDNSWKRAVILAFIIQAIIGYMLLHYATK